MSLRAPPPAESDLLCEHCGYILNGLQDSQGNCPECGRSTHESVAPGYRVDSPIEQEWSRRAFWRTTALILLQKRRFFRETRSRGENASVERFGRIHRVLSGAAFGFTGAIHGAWMAETRLWLTRWDATSLALLGAVAVVFAVLAVWLLGGVTRLATWLTSKEGAFWGMRLPSHVVTRAMSFHAANYLPVALVALLVTGGYRVALLLGITNAASGVAYLITLSVLVVVSALWLFESYVIAMRRIRLANY